jgi:glycosyltransferase involved in cell wall biosynthesis
MRLLHVIHSTNPASGGPIEAVKQLSLVHQEMQHQVTVVSLDAPASPWLPQLLFPVVALGPGTGNYGYTPRWLPWFKQNQSKFDAVIINGLWQYPSFGTWRALTETEIPYFVFPHGMLDVWFKRRYPLKHLKKCLYWWLSEYRVLRDARAVIFTAEQEKRNAQGIFRPYNCTERLSNLGIAEPPGNADQQKLAFLQKYPALDDKRIMLFLGRLHEKKGCDLLLRAFSRQMGKDSCWHLVMAGPAQPDALTSWQELASQLHLGDRVTWTGMLAGDLKWGAIRAAEVFALPSHQENFGLAVVESLACGTPVLISDAVNIQLEISAARAGLVQPDTQAGTDQLLADWLALTEAEHQAMRKRARLCFENHFEARHAATQLMQTLRQFGVK